MQSIFPIKVNLKFCFQIYAVGVGDARKEQLKTVTGSWSKVWADVSDFKSLTIEAARKIGNYICKNSCA